MITNKVLGEGENLIIQTRTHWKELFFPGLILVVTVGAAAYGVTLVPDADYALWVQLGIAAVGLLIIGIWSVRPWLHWLFEEYAVTDQRLITRSGILARSGRDIPLGRINDVTHERQLSDRLLGCGTLVVWSAGEQGRIELYDVPRVEHVQRVLSEQLFRSDGVNDPPQANTP